MTKIAKYLLVLALVGCSGMQKGSSQMQVIGAKDQKPLNIPATLFTGPVSVKGMFKVDYPTPLSGGLVSFRPKSRSNWHTHPMGQLLIVTEGSGLIQQWGGEIQSIQKGDVVWTPPGVKHWHGASPRSSMTHVAIQQSKDGKNVEWLEPVTDAQYSGKD